MPLLRLVEWISVRYLREQIGRSFISLLGVGLGVAVFVAIRLASGSAVAAFQEGVDSLSGDANLQISGRSEGVDETRFAKILDTPGVKHARPMIEALASNPMNAGEPLLVVGLDLIADDRIRTLLGSRGARSPLDALDMIVEPGSIAVSQSYAARIGWKEGSKIQLSYAGRRRDLTVRMLLPPQGIVRAYGGDVALMDIAGAQELFGTRGRIGRIDLVVEDGPAFYRVQRYLSKLFPGADVSTPGERGQQVEAMISSFRMNLMALALVALFVGAFLIFNNLSLSVVQRRREIGISRSLGVSSNQILALFLVEALFYGVLGSVIGLALGIIISKFALGSVSNTVSTMYASVKATQIEVDTTTLGLGFALGLVAAVFSGLAPALEAASTSPGLSSREGSIAQRRRSRVLALGICSLAFAASAWALCYYALQNRNGLVGFAATGLLLLASAYASPILTVILSRLVVWPVRKIAGVEGTIGVRWLVQSLERTSVVIAALASAVTMLIALNMMVGSFRHTLEVWMDQTVRADLFLEPASRLVTNIHSELPPGVMTIIAHQPGVKSWDALRRNQTLVDGKRADIFAFDLQNMADNSRLMFIDNANTHARVADALKMGGIFVSETFQSRFGKGRGDRLRLQTPLGPKIFPIVGVFYDYTTESGLILIHRPFYAKLWKDNAIDTAAIYVKPGVQIDQMRRSLQAKLETKYDIAIIPNRSLKERAIVIFDQTFAITNALKIIAVVIAVLGVVTTMAGLILRRQRDFGVMLSVGASRGQLAKIAVVESALIGIFGSITGMICGPIVALVLIKVINRLFFGWTIIPIFDVNWFASAAAWVVMASLLAGFVPARVASRMQPAQGVRDE